MVGCNSMLLRTLVLGARRRSLHYAARDHALSGQTRGHIIDLTGKVAFVAGVADSTGYGWAVAKQLANAGATILLGTWPPAMILMERGMRRGFGSESKLPDGSDLPIAKVYPLDVMFSTPAEVPQEIRVNKRYADKTDYDIQSCVAAVARDYGKVDILVHAIANGPDVAKPLLETSREGYLAASSASAFSMVSMVSLFGPIMPPGSACVSLSFLAAQRVVPGYGGGMSSAKAQLESDTKVLAWEAGRKHGIRVNSISAGPLASRAACAIVPGNGKGGRFIDTYIKHCRAHAPLQRDLTADDVGRAALALCSDLSSAITGTCLHVDNGLHAMACVPADANSFQNEALK